VCVSFLITEITVILVELILTKRSELKLPKNMLVAISKVPRETSASLFFLKTKIRRRKLARSIFKGKKSVMPKLAVRLCFLVILIMTKMASF
jgi:hypothetical protein